MAVTPLQANDLSRPRASEAGEISTDIPARLDRLPWSRFHVLVLVALGVTWILDGIEVTIVGAIGPVLQNQQTLGLSSTEIGGAASAYVVGAVLGAVLFGWLTDRFGRRTVFYVTLVVCLLGCPCDSDVLELCHVRSLSCPYRFRDRWRIRRH
jgi:MFS family permease